MSDAPAFEENAEPDHDFWGQLLKDSEINESGGEDTNDGVDFPRFWAMYLLVALERTKHSDYALLFEYLQDVAWLDRPAQPSSAKLFQLKKRDRKDWSIASLCDRPKVEEPSLPTGAEIVSDSGKGRDDGAIDLFGTSPPQKKRKRSTALRGQSPLGKLYLCVSKLPSEIDAKGVFVSNAPFNAKLPTGSAPELHSVIAFDSLCSVDAADISARLRTELNLSQLEHISKISFEHTKLQPATMRETVRGALGELLVADLNLPDTSGQLVAKLMDTFSRLGGRKPRMKRLEDIVREKGFTRAAFVKMLETASSATDFGDEIDKIISDLKSEGMPPKEANKLAAAAQRIAIRFVHSPEQRDTLRWHEAIDFARNADVVAETYVAMLDLTYNNLATLLSARAASSISSLDIKAVALLANIHVKNEPQTLGAQFTEKDR